MRTPQPEDAKFVVKIVGGFNPFEKYMFVKLDHEAPSRGGNNKEIFETTTYRRFIDS